MCIIGFGNLWLRYCLPQHSSEYRVIKGKLWRLADFMGFVSIILFLCEGVCSSRWSFHRFVRPSALNAFVVFNHLIFKKNSVLFAQLASSMFVSIRVPVVL